MPGNTSQFKALREERVCEKSHNAARFSPNSLHSGFRQSKVGGAEIGKYLGIIEERVKTRQTGARWLLKSLAAMEHVEPRDLRYRAKHNNTLFRIRDEPSHRATTFQADGLALECRLPATHDERVPEVLSSCKRNP